MIVTVNYPQTNTTFIDRFLASAEAYRIPVNIVINKTDCYEEGDKEYADALCFLYKTIGYNCYQVSAKTGEGMDKIKNIIENKVTLFSGNSEKFLRKFRRRQIHAYQLPYAGTSSKNRYNLRFTQKRNAYHYFFRNVRTAPRRIYH